MQNELKSNECWRIEFGFTKLLKLKYRMGDQIIQTLLQNWFPQELGPPSFISRNFKTLREVLPPESCRIHWNAMNNEEFGSIELLRLKYRRGDKIIQTFCKIGSPQKLGHLSLISRNLMALRRRPLDHAEYIEMQWTTKNLGLENF